MSSFKRLGSSIFRLNNRKSERPRVVGHVNERSVADLLLAAKTWHNEPTKGPRSAPPDKWLPTMMPRPNPAAHHFVLPPRPRAMANGGCYVGQPASDSASLTTNQIGALSHPAEAPPGVTLCCCYRRCPPNQFACHQITRKRLPTSARSDSDRRRPIFGAPLRCCVDCEYLLSRRFEASAQRENFG